MRQALFSYPLTAKQKEHPTRTCKSQGLQFLATAGRGKSTEPFVRDSLMEICGVAVKCKGEEVSSCGSHVHLTQHAHKATKKRREQSVEHEHARCKHFSFLPQPAEAKSRSPSSVILPSSTVGCHSLKQHVDPKFFGTEKERPREERALRNTRATKQKMKSLRRSR